MYYIIIHSNGIYAHLSSASEMTEEEVRCYYSVNTIYDIVDITNPSKIKSLILHYKIFTKEQQNPLPH